MLYKMSSISYITRASVAALLLGTAACGTDPQGIDPDLLEQAYAQARETPGIRSLLVQRHGVLVREAYFHGGAADSLEQVGPLPPAA